MRGSIRADHSNLATSEPSAPDSVSSGEAEWLQPSVSLTCSASLDHTQAQITLTPQTCHTSITHSRAEYETMDVTNLLLPARTDLDLDERIPAITARIADAAVRL